MTSLTQSHERLVSKESALPRLWGSEALKIGIKQADQGKISTLKRDNEVDVSRVNPSSERIIPSRMRGKDGFSFCNGAFVLICSQMIILVWIFPLLMAPKTLIMSTQVIFTYVKLWLWSSLVHEQVQSWFISSTTGSIVGLTKEQWSWKEIIQGERMYLRPRFELSLEDYW